MLGKWSKLPFLIALRERKDEICGLLNRIFFGIKYSSVQIEMFCMLALNFSKACVILAAANE